MYYSSNNLQPRFGELKTMNRFLVSAGFHAMAAATGGRGLHPQEHMEELENCLRAAKEEPEFDFFLRKPRDIVTEPVLLRLEQDSEPHAVSLQDIFRRPRLLGFSYELPNWACSAYRRFEEALEKIGKEPTPDKTSGSANERYFGQHADTLDLLSHYIHP